MKQSFDFFYLGLHIKFNHFSSIIFPANFMIGIHEGTTLYTAHISLMENNFATGPYTAHCSLEENNFATERRILPH